MFIFDIRVNDLNEMKLIFFLNSYVAVGMDKYTEYKADKYDSTVTAAKVIFFYKNITFVINFNKEKPK